jgi:hypothetical protein
LNSEKSDFFRHFKAELRQTAGGGACETAEKVPEATGCAPIFY